MRPKPLVVTADPGLAEAADRLAAVAGVEPDVSSDPVRIRAHWRSAPLVVVDERLAGVLLEGRAPRRAGVVVVARGVSGGPPGEATWRDAIALGAEHVIALPEAEPWLAERFAECLHGPSRDGAVLFVRGAVGGCGTSTIAAGLALESGRRGRRTLLVDGDPGGGGLDLLLGAEDLTGARWPDLAQVDGRLNPGTLADALPQLQGVSLLSWGRDGGDASPEAMESVLDAGARGFDLVVVDADRSTDCDLGHRSVMVVPSRLRGAAAAACLLASGAVRPQALAVRMVRGGIDAGELAAYIGWDSDVVAFPDSRAVFEAGEAGEPLAARDAFARACGRLLDTVDPVGVP